MGEALRKPQLDSEIARQVAAQHVFNGDEPVICVWTGQDDPCRGDSRGYEGIGRAVAGKLRGKFMYTRLPIESLLEYFNERGYPDIMMGGRVVQAMREGADLGPVTMKIGLWNEDLEAEFAHEAAPLNPFGLVSHHITPQRLAKEGAVFKEKHEGQIEGELIMVALTSCPTNCAKKFQSKLIKLLEGNGPSTLYVTGSPRTESSEFKEFMQALQRRLDSANLADRVRILGFDLNGEREVGNIEDRFDGFKQRKFYNPYIGLIANADHMVLQGDSLSMMSEMLMAGKSVMTFDATASDKQKRLQKEGLTINLASISANRSFITRPVDVPSLTDSIADGVVRKFERRAYYTLPDDVKAGLDIKDFNLDDYLPPVAANDDDEHHAHTAGISAQNVVRAFTP